MAELVAKADKHPDRPFQQVPGGGEFFTGGRCRHAFFSMILRKIFFPPSSGYQRYWDNQAKVPYLHNTMTKEFISFDDEQSISHKAQFINGLHLGGAMVWELGQDTRPGWDCMTTIKNALE